MEGELISALQKIYRLKKKNKLRKEQLQVCEEKDNKVSEEIVILKIHLDEAKRRKKKGRSIDKSYKIKGEYLQKNRSRNSCLKKRSIEIQDSNKIHKRI
jgi:uncharacterized membrane protein YcjF (UPF0283 family)